MLKYKLFFFLSSIGVLIAFLYCNPTLEAQSVKNDSTKTILLRPKLTPLETITADTLNTSPSGKVELIERIGGGEYPFTPEQDTAYYRALRLHTPTGTLAQLHARMFSGIWSEMHMQSRKNPWEIARQNLEIPADYYKPSAQDRALYAYNIAKSQEIPTGLGRTPGTGLQIPLSDIGAFLGLTEDVSPVLNYSVEYPMLVEVVIYSPQARVITVIMKAKQYPGNYRLTWNGRDDKGQKMPSGDYVAEVRLGNERYVRKRIEIP
ncbi:MAG: hypothetical protein JST20_12140 [Bacteroidetes bacterium]|nr:hypothetical protein [Bacteroidota bacterium]